MKNKLDRFRAAYRIHVLTSNPALVAELKSDRTLTLKQAFKSGTISEKEHQDLSVLPLIDYQRQKEDSKTSAGKLHEVQMVVENGCLNFMLVGPTARKLVASAPTLAAKHATLRLLTETGKLAA